MMTAVAGLSMSLAAETREAVREQPFVLDALRAGVLNHSAAGAWLAETAGIDGDPDAIATALRRFREELPAYRTGERTASVSMQSGVRVAEAGAGASDEAGPDTPDADPVLRVGGTAVLPDGRETAILASGDVDAAALAGALRRLSAVDVDVSAAGVAGDALAVVVGRRDGATAVRVVEAALDGVPRRDD